MAEKEYIEKGSLLKHFDDVINNKFGDADFKKAAWGFSIYVDNMPAADVAPVKHGHWVNENFYTHCSACGNMAIYDKYGQEVESDYCPRCGAKMGGEGE